MFACWQAAISCLKLLQVMQTAGKLLTWRHYLMVHCPSRCSLPPADSFNRWEAGQVLAKKLLRALYAAAKESNAVSRGLQAA